MHGRSAPGPLPYTRTHARTHARKHSDFYRSFFSEQRGAYVHTPSPTKRLTTKRDLSDHEPVRALPRDQWVRRSLAVFRGAYPEVSERRAIEQLGQEWDLAPVASMRCQTWNPEWSRRQ